MSYGHEAQNKVADFHRALDMPVGVTPELRRQVLRLGLISEECQELVKALEEDDFVEAIDALGDLLYVIYGAAIEWGIDLKPVFDEIHRSNMAKVGGPKRADGKQLKPAGWTPPDIARILRDQIAASPNVDNADVSSNNYSSVVGASATAALR